MTTSAIVSARVEEVGRPTLLEKRRKSRGRKNWNLLLYLGSVFLAFRNMHNTPRSQRAASRKEMSFKERVKKLQSCRSRRVLPARLLKSLSPRSSRPAKRMYRPLSIIDHLEPLNVYTFSRLGLHQLIRRLLTTAAVRVPNGCTHT
jgi:hypothetical protein